LADLTAARLRVLVVDDHPDTLRLFETYLTFAGFEVTTTTNAAAALRMSMNGFEAISTDLAMPGMDGVEFIRRMREARTKPPIPIVAVTGQGTEADEAADVGACRLLQKPCDLADLAGTLRELAQLCKHDCPSCPHNPQRGNTE
jgi:CheY-like chemotaxis protein